VQALRECGNKTGEGLALYGDVEEVPGEVRHMFASRGIGEDGMEEMEFRIPAREGVIVSIEVPFCFGVQSMRYKGEGELSLAIRNKFEE
jgi:hypothetical protein